jgi:hypothetical protein
VLGDEAQPADGARRATGASGPRHAAPRKSLLTKLHMPAGKAVALAAMPTALLMGLGFTPHLTAQADELPKSPYKPGPCVTQPDTPATQDADGAKKDGADSGTSKDSGSTGDDAKDAKDSKDAKGTGESTGSKDAGGSDAPSAGATESPKPPTTQPPADEEKSEPAPSASPSPTKSVNPLDPLGLGDLLGGLLGVDKKSSATTTDPAASDDSAASDASDDSDDSAASDADSAAPEPSASATPKPSTTTAPPKVSDTVKSTVETADTAVKDAEDALKGATDGAGKTVKSVTDAATGDTGADGPQPFPCPTYDAEALAAAETEPGIPLLADDPWVLKSSLLTLYGLKYEGIVKVRTYSGTVKDVLKFTATGVDIGDLSQTVDGPNGTKTHVTARKGSTSTIRNGTVTMYTESISGNLLGVIPITFTPKAPPPLSLPVMFFTDCTVIQAAQFGGDLTVPGMKVLPGQAS